ncbi:MAG: class II aldolase/adducin family protein [Gammaproteobacteria bacterium]|jgi:L-fuculose-phosphate aldolase
MDPRLDLIRHYRWLRQYGLNDSHSGNVSVRSGDDYWISPTGACADTLEADALVRCALAGPPAAGASLDAPLHRAVYLKNPGAGAVVHSHGAYSVAVTLSGDDFVPVDFEGRYYFSRIPVLDIAYDEYLPRSPGLVSETLARHPVAVVRGHGVYACAETLNLAYKWTCSFELSARTWLLARQAGSI